MAHPNEDIVRRYIEGIGAGDFDTVASLVSDDLVLHLPGRSKMSGDKTKEETIATLKGLHEASPDALVPNIHDILASDDHVVALVTRKIAGVVAPAAIVYHLSDGKITEIWPHEAKQYEVDEAVGS